MEQCDNEKSPEAKAGLFFSGLSSGEFASGILRADDQVIAQINLNGTFFLREAMRILP